MTTDRQCTVYVAGPMSGLPEFNFPAFHEAAEKLRSLGYRVFNPAENDGGDTSKSWAYYMRLDIAMVLQSDAIAVLPGWKKSKGASLEILIGWLLGLNIFCIETMKPIKKPMIVAWFEKWLRLNRRDE